MELSDSRVRTGVDQGTDWLAGACLFLAADDFRRVGGFDEAFYMYGEDTDLGMRLHIDGIPSVYLGSVSITHGLSASSDPSRIAYWNAAARFQYAEKWGFRRRLAAGLTLTLGLNLLYNTVRRATGKEVRPLVRARYEWSLLVHGMSRHDPRVAPSALSSPPLDGAAHLPSLEDLARDVG